MKICIIAAVADNGVIGNQGKIPWHIPEDLKRFKKITTGHAVIMGRKTFDSIGRPLPDRLNVVLTRKNDHGLPSSVTVADTLEKALEACRRRGVEKAFVIGGAEVYAQAIPAADEMILTIVHRSVEGDARFPEWDRSPWKEAGHEEGPGITYVTYRREKR